MLKTLQHFACMFVVTSILWLIYSHFSTYRQAATNNETYTSELHATVVDAIESFEIMTKNPVTALAKIQSAHARVTLLSKLAGGDVVLAQITGKDVAHILNTMILQEEQIRQAIHHFLPRTHPLDTEIEHA
jgi:environmental stress-induced protein Ves